MKTLLLAATGLSLILAPMAAQAQSHRSGGSFRSQAAPSAGARGPGWEHGTVTGRTGSTFRGGTNFRGGNYRGGNFRGGYGYRGGYYPRYGYGYDYGLGGLGLGLVAGAALASPYYYNPGYYDYGYDDPAYGYGSAACGDWVWVPSRGRYVWEATYC